MTQDARRGANKHLRKSFWRRNKAPLRLIGAAVLVFTTFIASMAIRIVLVAYRASRPRVVEPLARISYVDVATHKGSAFRITDETSCERLRSILNSKVGRWASRASFWEAIFPVEGVRALDLELSIETAGVHRIFDVSSEELQSEGAVTPMNQSVWGDFRITLDEAPDGDECGERRPLGEVFDSRCVAQAQDDVTSTWCGEACGESAIWIAKCEDLTANVALVSMGRSHSRFYYDKSTGRLVGAKAVAVPGQKATCFGSTPVTRGCVRPGMLSCSK